MRDDQCGDELLRAEVWVGNQDVGFVDQKQPVKLKIAAFSFQKYGMVEGNVLQVSADATEAPTPNTRTSALETAQNLNSNVNIQIEVENISQLEEALSAGAKSVLLDNFEIEDMEKAVKINNKRALLEVSGGVSDEMLKLISLVGVDRVSIGKLTKSVDAADFSWRFLTVD